MPTPRNKHRELVYRLISADETVNSGDLYEAMCQMHRAGKLPEVERVEDLPKPRTIDKMKAEYRSLGQQAQAQYRRIQWPDSFGTSDLPWEAAGPLYRAMDESQDALGGPWEPTTSEAVWFWRIYQARPDASSEHLRTAAFLMTWERFTLGLRMPARAAVEHLIRTGHMPEENELWERPIGPHQ